MDLIDKGIKALTEATQGVLGGFGRDLAVDLHGDGDLAVPQDGHLRAAGLGFIEARERLSKSRASLT